MEVTQKQLEEARRGQLVKIGPVVDDDRVVVFAVLAEVADKLALMLEAEEVDPSFFECEDIESPDFRR